MRKTPFTRQNNAVITQPFADGIVTIYAVTDTAEPGRTPVEKLTEKGRLRYDEQRLGLQRYYQGRQNQMQIERVVRVPRGLDINSQDVAETEDGRRYRIDLVQSTQGVYPPCLDLTLAKIERVRGK